MTGYLNSANTGMRTCLWVTALLAALTSSPVSAATNWDEIRRAAEGGDGDAAIMLGYRYLLPSSERPINGAIATSESQLGGAMPSSERPINGGIPTSESQLGGDSSERHEDRIKAYVWLTLGVERHKHPKSDTVAVARDDLEKLIAKMTDRELLRGIRLVRQWRKGRPPGHDHQEKPQPGHDRPIVQAQKLLTRLGYAPGPIDGTWGPRTKRAYTTFMLDAGLAPREFSPDVLAAMQDVELKSALGRRDYKTARRLLKPSAERGNAEAQAFLAQTYIFGQADNRDYRAAVKWARKSAAQNNIEGYNALGFLSFFGHGGLTTDYKKAADLYEKAAKAGLPSAEYMLANLYAYGLGRKQDFRQAAKWARSAADGRFPHAFLLYAEFLAKGTGVQRNRVRAYQAYTIGIQKFRKGEGITWSPSGHEAELQAKAINGLHDLWDEMTQDERAQAVKIAGKIVWPRPAAPTCPDGSAMQFGFCPPGG